MDQVSFPREAKGINSLHFPTVHIAFNCLGTFGESRPRELARDLHMGSACVMKFLQMSVCNGQLAVGEKKRFHLWLREGL